MNTHNTSAFVVFASLILTVAMNGTGIPVVFADDLESRPAKELNFAKLVEELVSPNKLPVTQNQSMSSVKFPAGYDVAAQRRINDIRQTLYDNVEDSLPFLINALDDKRYCLTINWAEGDGFYNESVGAICRDIIESHLEVYRDKFFFSDSGHYHKYDYKPISREWWQARRDRKLYELQIEAVEWAIQKLEKDDDSDPRFDKKTQLSDLRKLRDSIAKERKPAKPRRMHKMQTRDVGRIR